MWPRIIPLSGIFLQYLRSRRSREGFWCPVRTAQYCLDSRGESEPGSGHIRRAPGSHTPPGFAGKKRYGVYPCILYQSCLCPQPFSLYDRQTASKERVEWVGEREHPKIATPENVTVPPYYPDHEITRQELARYYNSVSGIDIRVGWILEELKIVGLADNTIIFFFGDNGRLDARGIHWCWDTGLRIPLVIYFPETLESPPQ